MCFFLILLLLSLLLVPLLLLEGVATDATGDTNTTDEFAASTSADSI